MTSPIKHRSAEMDPSFGESGRLEVRTPGNFPNNMKALTVDASGRILVSGGFARDTPGNDQGGIGRLRTDGTTDETFGATQDGFTAVPKVMPPRGFGDAAPMANGTYFVNNATQSELRLVRYDQTGQYVDTQRIQSARGQTLSTLLETADGKLLIATLNTQGGRLYRRNNDGSIDESFGLNGSVEFLSGNDFVNTMDMVRQGRSSSIYLVGELNTEGFITRLNSNGEVDKTFASEGIFRVSLEGAYSNSCRRIVELADGNILVMINRIGTSASSLQLICLTPAGAIDPAFNGGEPLSIGSHNGICDMTVQKDGKILVAHPSTLTGNHLTRFFSDGRPDTAFGSDGTGTLTFEPRQLRLIKGVMVQPDGKILISGQEAAISVLLRLIP